MGATERLKWAALAAGLAAVLAGCGTPGTPLPPSLKLPDPVTDLAAVRAGSQVSLTWKMPKKNTDKLLLKGNIPVRVCRREGAGACETAGADLMVAPGAEGSYTDTLPAGLTAGTPRALSYFIELKNQNGRSAGLSNGAQVLAGEAPAPVAGLRAEMRKDGVVLRWTPDSADAAVRLHRKLLTPTQQKHEEGPLAPGPEPLEQNLLVEAGGQTGRAVDKNIRFGETYEYRAQRVARVKMDGQTLELAGELSAPVRIDAENVFPPAVPAGLAAVVTEATAQTAETRASIDLSWQPDTEADLAGYIVYRREGDGDWRRISPAQPVVGPAFRDTQVQPGHSYRYAVSAVDQGGHESGRSAEAEETVPRP